MFLFFFVLVLQIAFERRELQPLPEDVKRARLLCALRERLPADNRRSGELLPAYAPASDMRTRAVASWRRRQRSRPVGETSMHH